jgi:hypothetical protein
MALFADAIGPLLHREGGYVNHPSDPGGETKYGISKRAYPNEDIKNLTPARASLIYKRDYWDKLGLDQCPNEGAARVLFDIAVHSGVGRARRCLEACGGLYEPYALVDSQAAFLQKLVDTRPDKYKPFEKGWKRRIFLMKQELATIPNVLPPLC